MTKQGFTVFDRIPNGPHSAASIFDIRFTPALDELYAPEYVSGGLEATVEMCTRRPDRWRIITGPTRWDMRKVPVRFRSSTAFQSSRGRSSIGANRKMPAVLTSTSTRPKSATTASTRASTEASSVMSARYPRAVVPCSASRVRAASSSRSWGRSTSARRAPLRASSRQISDPIPPSAPVTMQTSSSILSRPLTARLFSWVQAAGALREQAMGNARPEEFGRPPQWESAYTVCG